MPRMAAAVAFAAVLSLVACSQQASQPATPPVAATPVPQPQAARELDMYRKLLAEYPRDQKVYGAKQALKRRDEIEARIRAELQAEAGQTP